MSLAHFTLPVDTRLIRYRNELFKFKVLFEDVDNLPPTYSEEIETVIKTYVHQQNKGTLKNVQSKNLLIDISTKTWKASKVLRFKVGQKELKTYAKEIHFKVQCKIKSHQKDIDQGEGPEKIEEIEINHTNVRSKRQRIQLDTCNIAAAKTTSDHKNCPEMSKAGPSKELQRDDKIEYANNKDGVGIKVPKILDPNIYKAKVNLGKPIDQNICHNNPNLNSNNNNSNCVHTNTYVNRNSDYNRAGIVAFSKESEQLKNVSDNSHNLSSESSRRKRKINPPSVSSSTSQIGPANVLSYTRDRAVIHQEDLEEEMKFQEMVSVLPTTQQSKYQSHKKSSSLISSAWEVLISPVKYFLRSRKNNLP